MARAWRSLGAGSERGGPWWHTRERPGPPRRRRRRRKSLRNCSSRVGLISFTGGLRRRAGPQAEMKHNKQTIRAGLSGIIPSLTWSLFTSLLTHRLVLLCVDANCFTFWDLPGAVLAAPESALCGWIGVILLRSQDVFRRTRRYPSVNAGQHCACTGVRASRGRSHPRWGGSSDAIISIAYVHM